jgi:hypothetical protein
MTTAIARVTRPNWGPWFLDTDLKTLNAEVSPHFVYEVDLDRCLSSAALLDWIFQVAEKTWADEAVITGLIRATGDILNPQGTLCSGTGGSGSGTGKQISPADIARLVQSTVGRSV